MNGQYADSAQARELDELRAEPMPEGWDDPAFVQQCRENEAHIAKGRPARIRAALEELERRFKR